MSKSLGHFGESWAAAYLQRLGYRIVERNVYFRCGELDLVAYDGPVLVFVEVKTRRTEQFGRPEESITRRRFTHLAAAAEQYLADRQLAGVEYRVDVVALVVGTDGRVRRSDLIRGVELPS